MPTLSEILDLRLSVLEHHPFFGSRNNAKKAITDDHRTILREASKNGVIEALYHDNGKLRAALLAGRAPAYWGRGFTQIKTLLLPGDPQALAWMKNKLKSHPEIFQKKAFLRIDVQNRELVDFTCKLGLHVESLILAGDPKVGLTALKRNYGNLFWPKSSGLEICTLQSAHEIEEIIKIVRREFKRNPQYGWFVTTPTFLRQKRKLLDRERKREDVTQYVIYRNKKVVGHFGFEISDTSPFGVRYAGMAISLTQEIQGQGLAKHAYFVMLKRMIELGVVQFLGGTSQKPIMKLGAVMKRPVVAYAMKTGPAYFKKRHFKY